MAEPQEPVSTTLTETPDVKSKPASTTTGWLIVTGLLVLLSLTTWVYYGKIKLGAVQQQAVKQKGQAIVRALVLCNPDILSPEGNKNAQDLFVTLTTDPNVTYVILQDNTGVVKAASNAIFMQQSPEPAVGNDVIIKDGKEAGTDIDVVGPIKNPGGAQIGSIHVGLSYAARK